MKPITIVLIVVIVCLCAFAFYEWDAKATAQTALNGIASAASDVPLNAALVTNGLMYARPYVAPYQSHIAIAG